MAGRRGDGHRIVRWLWTSRRLDARLARATLLPASGLWRLAIAGRNLAFDRGWRASARLPVPSIGVGNLTVGGSGKTPVASWIAGWLAARGVKPGVLLRGYGADEVLVHRHAVPEALVVADPDRHRGAEQAVAEGAEVLVLDDAFQRRDVIPDFNLLLVAAETGRAVRWPLPAGPWREPLSAVGRADFLLVTRKRADLSTATSLARELAGGIPTGVVHLAVQSYVSLVHGRSHPASILEGKRVVAASAIADPSAFIAQTKAAGAQVQAATWRDHHDFEDQDVAWLARAARKADFLVITEKDAVKLRDRWPASVPEPLVAALELHWEAGREQLEQRLDALVTRGRSD
ncbi:MAG: tetraacyldisaccharide 4'-kinase [Gemmatimonadales bacterium]